jgi:eukaryotic-like serine/threonine-protein kinase
LAGQYVSFAFSDYPKALQPNMEMTPAKWERVKVLFEAALDRPAEQRLGYLKDACDDDDLRDEVARLLANLEDAGSFLSKPVPSGLDLRAAQTEGGSLPPNQVLAGRFKLIRFLARGGMGEVYEAEDEELQERVALKIVRPDLLRDPSNLQRFKREVHLAKNVTHPNICRTHDLFRHREPNSDSTNDIMFVSMELLVGETLSQYFRGHGRLTPTEALPLITHIAEGMNAAHSVGIVHRDFKPGNVILVSRGAGLFRPVITDFGLALRSGGDTVTFKSAITASHGIVGTPAYMAPEQIQGREVTAATDIYALGLVMYEMLTGTQPFSGETPFGMAYRRIHEPPPSPRTVIPNFDPNWEAVILRCLERDPTKRFTSVTEVVGELSGMANATEPESGINFRVLFRQSKRPKVAIPVLLSLLTLASVLVWWIHHSSRVKWARDEAVPQIAQLLEQEKFGEAYALADQAEKYIPHDPQLVKFWPHISWSATITTNPTGASVYRRNYNAPGSPWEFIGRAPIEGRRFPLIDSEWKFELKGYATVERATFPSDSLSVTMDEEAKVPAGMVRVQFPSTASLQSMLYGLAGFETLPSVPLTEYWINKFEVTNGHFKRFIDQGGYQKQEYWKHEFRKDGRVLSWAEAMKSFQDRTGRPGPATWIQGEYPHGEENYPVTGVSWFEATAYAEFAGESLPTIYHWIGAAAPQNSVSIIPASNIGGTGPAPVGAHRDMSWSGAFDMAGNVKEWISNEASPGNRYIMGGAWNEPAYMFNNADARSAFERSANFGFRCAKYIAAESAKAADPILFQARDYSREKPVSEKLFLVYKSLYSYDKTPLNAALESTHETNDWKVEKIAYDAAYGNERISAYLFLPRKASPPYQVVVFFPGANAIRTRSSANSPYLDNFDFILKSGRAVMFPLYKGTFERGDGLNNVWPNTSSSYRDHVITWSKDLGRSIDYLQTRPDLDHNKLAYEGFSWGASMGAILPAVEDRLKALVLLGPGFYLQKRLPEVDQLNFAPRVKVPVLMLNGRFDFIYPPETSQEPMFRLLGTPKEQKRRVVYGTGHDIPRTEMIKETLDWLDRFLGPVQ